jgi:RimJ/RimL family protein N-acetyltransferase
MIRFRQAGSGDAAAVAQLHAESWRRHYRGAYSDSFLDGDVVADRLAVWTERLREPDPRRCTILAEDGGLAGFANTFFDDDPTWGALVDNLHVADGHRRRGIGSRLLALTADAVLARPEPTGLYLWVLEQNRDARRFYEACGGKCVEPQPVPAPGGIASRLAGSPMGLRYAWRQADLASGAMTTVRIEPWGPDDLPLLERLLGDPAMMEHLGGPETPDQIAARHARYLADKVSGLFRILCDGEPAGWVGYWTRDWREREVYEVGWSVLPEQQGRGIATLATSQAIELARREGQHRFMHAFPSVDNVASNAICRKLGFELLGDIEFEYPKGRLMRCNDWRLELAAR